MQATFEHSPINARSSFNSSLLYEDELERSRHQEYIVRLAVETNTPIQVIEPLYEAALARLKAGATIQDYLPILVAKGVKTALKESA